MRMIFDPNGELRNLTAKHSVIRVIGVLPCRGDHVLYEGETTHGLRSQEEYLASVGIVTFRSPLAAGNSKGLRILHMLLQQGFVWHHNDRHGVTFHLRRNQPRQTLSSSSGQNHDEVFTAFQCHLDHPLLIERFEASSRTIKACQPL
jgi:hypothetical protein